MPIKWTAEAHERVLKTIFRIYKVDGPALIDAYNADWATGEDDKLTGRALTQHIDKLNGGKVKKTEKRTVPALRTPSKAKVTSTPKTPPSKRSVTKTPTKASVTKKRKAHNMSDDEEEIAAADDDDEEEEAEADDGEESEPDLKKELANGIPHRESISRRTKSARHTYAEFEDESEHDSHQEVTDAEQDEAHGTALFAHGRTFDGAGAEAHSAPPKTNEHMSKGPDNTPTSSRRGLIKQRLQAFNKEEHEDPEWEPMQQ